MDPRAFKAKSWRATCEVCDKTFSYPDGFDCSAQPGRHTVEKKVYYHLGGGHIQNIKERRLFTPTLNLKANEETRDKLTGQISSTPGVLVTFRESGIYDTTDPQEQFYLDQHPAVLSGDEGHAAWEKMYLTPAQQLDRTTTRLADMQRQLREGNALLDAVKTRAATPPGPGQKPEVRQ
jgi:hypothetical protein